MNASIEAFQTPDASHIIVICFKKMEYFKILLWVGSHSLNMKTDEGETELFSWRSTKQETELTKST